MAITKHDVFTAADAIVAEGGNPSQVTVRKRLGSGSNTTISQFLAEWRIDQESIRINAILRNAAPQELLDRLIEVGNEAWLLVTENFESRLQAERKDIQKEFDEALKEANRLNDQLQAELETVQEALRIQTARAVAAEEHSHLLGKALANVMTDECVENDLFSTSSASSTNRSLIKQPTILQLQAELQIAKKNLAAGEAKIDLLQNQLQALNGNSVQASNEALASHAALAVAETRVKQLSDDSEGK